MYGTARRERSTLVPQALMARNQTVTGYYVGQWFAGRPAQSLEAFNSLVTLIQPGKLTVSAADRLPLLKAADAHRTMETRQATGKIVLNPWEAGAE